MTSCPAEDELVALVDGALDAAHGDAVMDHLVDCADCRALLARSEAALRAALGGMADADAAVVAVAGGEVAGDERVAPRPPAAPLFSLRRVAVAAALLVAGAVGWAAARTSAPALTEDFRETATLPSGERADLASDLRDLLATAQRISADADAAALSDHAAAAALAAAEARIALGLPTGFARLHDVVERFPDTLEAREARARIASLGDVR